MTKKEAQARKIIKKLLRAGFTAYLAGGCVRDRVMGIKSKDYDIATSAKPQDIMALFKRTLAVGAHFGVVIVLDMGEQFEVATFRKDGPYSDGRRPDSVTFADAKEDVLRRDFTINGLLYDTINEKIIDYVGGVKDIKKGVIKTIGQPLRRFSEDRLRLIRAVRFSARFNFKIHDQTYKAIEKIHSEILGVSAERIKDEITKIITGPNRGLAIELLKKTKLLKDILPEVDMLEGISQPPEFHPEGDVLDHTKLVLDFLREPCETL
ncbi:MAG: CCA tRNA nucleotidyltransferase, partial [Elusimicrobiota bacterium]